jgi:hypothetical protein
MTEFKNLKVPEQTHELLSSRAESLGVKIFVLADALLRTGLTLSDREIQDAVVNARQPPVTPPTTDTTRERPPDQSPARGPSDE